MNIQDMVRLHRAWLDRENCGIRADFSGANLKGANFSGAKLDGANFSGANLEGAFFINGNFKGANFKNANLAGAHFSGAYLINADFSDANLNGAHLGETYFTNADFSNASLENACFLGANLKNANLKNANLRGADFKDAFLRGANLSGAILPAYMVCPEKGSFIAYKALRNKVTAVLEVPAEAKRTSSLIGRKCRAEFVRVLKLINCTCEYGMSFYDPSVVYRVGEMVYPDAYNDDIRVESAPGIHFFMTRKEAKNYC